VSDGTTQRTLALAGVFGPLVFWSVVLGLGSLDPDYSHLDHAMSVVAARQAPFSPFGRIGFVLAGLLIVAFAAGLARDRQRDPPGVVGAATLALHGIGRIGEGVFAWDLSGVAGVSNTLHTLFGMLALASMLLAPVILAWAFRADDRWRSFSRPTVAMAAAFVGVFVVLGPPSVLGPLGIPDGLGQRLGFGIWYLWLIGLAVTLYRIESPSSG
jgi:hypothetical membrane protein